MSNGRQFLETIDMEQKKPEKEIDRANECVHKLQEAYDKANEEIRLFRKKINDLLKTLERISLPSFDALLIKMEGGLKSDAEERSKLKEGFKNIQEAVKHIKGVKPNVQMFFAHIKSTEMSTNAQTLIKQTSVNQNIDIIFQCNADVET